MARASRVALDLALVSLRKVGPVVSNGWSATKHYIIKTPAKPLVCNAVVNKTELAVNKGTDKLISKMTSLRDSLLPKEKEYLERELEKVKKRIQDESH